MTPRLLSLTAMMAIKTRTRGIRTNFIFCSSLLATEVSRAIYVDFLADALAKHRFTAPDPIVIGSGLEAV